MGEQVDCLFCKEGASRHAEGSELRWTCQYCGEYWTTLTVAEIPSWEAAFFTRDRLEGLRVLGIGRAQHPITPEDLGLREPVAG